MGHREQVGVIKNAIKTYLWTYGGKDKHDIREFLRKNFPDIRFRTYDAIDKHLLELKNAGEIVIEDEGYPELIYITRKAIDNMIENLDKELLEKELKDWDFHIRKTNMDAEINKWVIETIVEVRSKKGFRIKEFPTPFNLEASQQPGHQQGR